MVGSPTNRATGERWHRLDHSRLRPNAGRLSWEDPDFVGATTVLSGVQSATRQGSVITGTLDGTKAMAIVDVRSRKEPTPATEAEAAPLRSRPYEAKLDDAGRRTLLAFDMPRFGMFPAGRWSIAIVGTVPLRRCPSRPPRR